MRQDFNNNQRNNNGNRGERKNYEKRERPVMIQKDFSFKCDSFDEGFKRLLETNDVICDLINQHNYENRELFDENQPVDEGYAKLMILDLFSDFHPVLSRRENIVVDLRCSAYKTFLKTNKFIGFGWDSRWEQIQNSNEVSYTYDFKISLYGSEDRMQDKITRLKEFGWVEELQNPRNQRAPRR